MIFDNNFDLPLYYMLKCDIVNRRKILKFLKEMPIEAIEEIRKTIEEYNTKNNNDNAHEYDVGTYKVPNTNISYVYSVDSAELTISKEVNGEEKFELLLYPISKQALKQMEAGDDEWLGVATTKIKVISHYKNGLPLVTDEKENEYSIYKCKMGYFVGVGHNVVGEFYLPIFRPVNINKAPDDINFSDIGISKKLSIGKKKPYC